MYLAPGGGGGYYGAGPFLASGLGFGGYGGYGGFGTSGYGPFYGGFGLVPRAALFAGSGGRRY
ncbi:MAG: hypothetical protein HC834_04185 [Rhodospirillales bacterium]|nr:hypothetical protein [Rhodospirillales bacterium]